MHWIVGVGLAPEDCGALEFAAWLQENTEATLEVVTAVPIVPAPGLSKRAEAKLRAEFSRVQAEAIAEAEPVDVAETTVVVGPSTEGVLQHRAMERQAGLIVGRAATQSDPGVVRLGRTARRLLRSLPGPTAVVPADLTRAVVRDGPVLLAIDAHDDCLGAAAFARSLGREIVLVHALESPTRGLSRVPEVERAVEESHLSAIRAFVAAHDLDGFRLDVRDGTPVEAILSAASDVRASVVVCGSRRLGLAERVFVGSTASMVAAAHNGPVIVVPAPA